MYKSIYTRLIGRFAPIFYLNCEHVLFVYILKQRIKNFFLKLKTFKTHFFLFVIIHKNLGPIGSAVLMFIRYKQTDTQIDTQTKFIYR